MKTLSTNEGGRPTKLDDELVVKLESILKIGGTIEEACSYALINKTTYYRWIENDEGFATKMESAKRYSDILAKNIVVDSMHKDRNLDTAKWWLEKREFRQPIMAQQFNIGKEMRVIITEDKPKEDEQ